MDIFRPKVGCGTRSNDPTAKRQIIIKVLIIPSSSIFISGFFSGKNDGGSFLSSTARERRSGKLRKVSL
jgi:hypothetical protein